MLSCIEFYVMLSCVEVFLCIQVLCYAVLHRSFVVLYRSGVLCCPVKKFCDMLSCINVLLSRIEFVCCAVLYRSFVSCCPA